jgi:hypothetical protein
VSSPARTLLLGLACAAALSCREAGCLGGELGSIAGQTGNSACDRRYIDDGGSSGPFCQEIIDTLASSQFQDDCRKKFEARTYDGKCSRDLIIAGCKNKKVNDDNSEVWDWYYDVRGFEQEAGVEAGVLFNDPPRTVEDVKALCADPKRYEDGAELATP